LRNYENFGGWENMPMWAAKGFLSRMWKEEERLEREMKKKRRGRTPKSRYG
jgi:hypothetical protein